MVFKVAKFCFWQIPIGSEKSENIVTKLLSWEQRGDYYLLHTYRQDLVGGSVSAPTAEQKGTAADFQTFAEVDQIGGKDWFDP